MEIWKDFQTGKYYSIDHYSGRQSPSSKFGGERKVFKAYSTGFPHIIKPKEQSIDKMYTVQPGHFDGYCQFPRPPMKSSTKSPYSRKSLKSEKIRIKDQSKIPNPLDFLSMTQGRSMSPHRTNPLYSSLPEASLNSIQDIKKSLIKTQLKDVKTYKDLTARLEVEKKNSAGFIRPRSKQIRRKLKGVFLKEFNTSGDLFKKEKKIWENMNPGLFRKRKKMEEFDRKMLEKKCQATRLMMNS